LNWVATHFVFLYAEDLCKRRERSDVRKKAVGRRSAKLFVNGYKGSVPNGLRSPRSENAALAGSRRRSWSAFAISAAGLCQTKCSRRLWPW